MLKTSRDPLAEAKQLATPLLQRGFSVGREEYAPKVFGNLVLELSSSTLVIRLARERGEYSLDVRSPQDDEWFDHDVILRFLGESEAGEDPNGKMTSPESMIAAFCERLPRVVEVFSDERYPASKVRLKRIEQDRAAAAYGYRPPN